MTTTKVSSVRTRGQDQLRPQLSPEDIRALKVGYPLNRSIATRLERAFGGPDGFDRLYSVAHDHGIPAHILGGHDKYWAVREALDHASEKGTVVQFVEAALGLAPSAKTTDTRIDRAILVVERFFYNASHLLSEDDLDVKVRGTGLVARLRNFGDDEKTFAARHARDLVEARAQLAAAGYPDIALKIEPIPEVAYP